MAADIPTCDRRYFLGGMSKCCVRTILATKLSSRIGDVIDCVYCENRMIVGCDGWWRVQR